MRLKSDGFSLVELMITVAIIGILSATAAPQFSRMRAKAKQSEALAALGSIYTAESAFYGANNTYTYCLFQAGYIPNLGRRFYLTGFYNTAATDPRVIDVPYLGNCSFTAIVWDGVQRNDSTFQMNGWANPALNGAGIGSGHGVFPDSFEAVAFGSVSASSPVFDIWTINELKQIRNIQEGL